MAAGNSPLTEDEARVIICPFDYGRPLGRWFSMAG
jgi:hypothetical protein